MIAFFTCPLHSYHNQFLLFSKVTSKCPFLNGMVSRRSSSAAAASTLAPAGVIWRYTSAPITDTNPSTAVIVNTPQQPKASSMPTNAHTLGRSPSSVPLVHTLPVNRAPSPGMSSANTPAQKSSLPPKPLPPPRTHLIPPPAPERVARMWPTA
jgi:hypothetical protein